MAHSRARPHLADDGATKESIMKRWLGGTRVPAGFYWRPAGWEMVTLSGRGGVLPGERSERYLRVPVLAMLVLAPAMGAALVMFLPLIGFAMAGRELARKTRDVVAARRRGRRRAERAPMRKAA
jgi:hypothetical protein